MKILFISPQIPLPANDGGKLSIWGLVNNLYLLGHEIDFLSYKKKHNSIAEISDMAKICNPIVLEHNTENSIFGVVRNFLSIVPYNISKYRSKKLEDYLGIYFKDNSPDIIHVNNLHMAWTVDITKKYSSAPIVLRQENVEMFIMKRFYNKENRIAIKFFSYLQYQKFKKYEPRICAKFDKCIMISPIDERELNKLNTKIRITNIPAGIEIQEDQRKVHNNRSEFSLVHIGNIEWYPNQDGLNWFINNVMGKLIDQISNLKLYIYGKGDYTKLNIPQDIKQSIIIEGFVDDLWAEISPNQIAIVPLWIGSGIRIKILECLAKGINVISTDIGCEGIGLENNKQLLIANSEDQFIDAVKKLKQDPKLFEDLKINGQKFMKNLYDWKIIARKFEKLYTELLR